MSIHQWFVISLNVAAFIVMITMFVVYGKKDMERAKDPSEAAPVDYRQYRRR